MAERTVEDPAPERFEPSEGTSSLMATEHFLRYLWATSLASGKNVLDAGCGSGYGASLLARAGAKRVVGVDISETAIAAAKEQAREVEFLRADVADLPLDDGSFDLVTCFEVIEHVENRGEIVAELKRVLVTDGILALSSPNRAAYPGGNPHHLHEYLPDELLAELAAHFEHVELYRQDALLASAIVRRRRRVDGPLGEQAVAASLASPLDDGSEPYVIAIAADAELPTVAERSLLGDPFEVRWWHDELDARRQREAELVATVSRAREEGNYELTRLSEQARKTGAALLELESKRAVELEELSKARAEIEALERRHDEAQTTIQAMQRTRVWRLGSAYWRVRDGALRRRGL